MNRVPDLYVTRFTDITPDLLSRLNVRGVLTDLDETLVGHGDEPTDEVLSWLRALVNAGFRICIVSNNSKKRTQPFAAKMGIPFLSRAHKPHAFRVARAVAALDLTPAETVFIGDQLYTDMGAARRVGMKAVLVDPIRGKKRHVFVDLRRRVWEDPIRKTFRKETEL